MPVTIGTQIRTVADIFETALKCSKTEANALEREICKSPSSIAKLATACGLSKMGVGYGGVILLTGAGAPEGLTISALGLMGVRRFCAAMPDRLNDSLSDSAGNP